MAKFFLSSIFLVATTLGSAQEKIDYDHLVLDYNENVTDLFNVNTIGYKDHLKAVDLKGPLLFTGRALDVALAEPGNLVFFDPRQKTYHFSRNGSLNVDSDGLVVNSDGASLWPPIRIKADLDQSSLKITTDGKIEYRIKGHSELMGETIRTYDLPTDGKTSPPAFVEIKNQRFEAGFLESSTVVVKEKITQLLAQLELLNTSNLHRGDYNDRLAILKDLAVISDNAVAPPSLQETGSRYGPKPLPTLRFMDYRAELFKTFAKFLRIEFY